MSDVIKVKPWGIGQGEFVILDSDQFDPNFHTLYSEEKTCTEESKSASEETNEEIQKQVEIVPKKRGRKRKC
jgi:hypothetical protein